MSSKRVKIQYRKLSRENEQFPASLTLAEAIIEAMDSPLSNGTKLQKSVQDRLAPVPGQEDSQRVLNNYFTDGKDVFGTICLFSRGELQALLKPSELSESEISSNTLEAWDIEERKAPTGNEYLHAICYWYVVEDHFYIIQHGGIEEPLIDVLGG